MNKKIIPLFILASVFASSSYATDFVVTPNNGSETTYTISQDDVNTLFSSSPDATDFLINGGKYNISGGDAGFNFVLNSYTDASDATVTTKFTDYYILNVGDVSKSYYEINKDGTVTYSADKSGFIDNIGLSLTPSLATDIDVRNSVFMGNALNGSTLNVTANVTTTLNISDSMFISNSRESYDGGAINIKANKNGVGITANIKDTIFIGNSTSHRYGGAICFDKSWIATDALITIEATKDLFNYGNTAKSANSGFLFLGYSGTTGGECTIGADFKVAENATMTIGNGTSASDGIGSSTVTTDTNKASLIFKKTGAGDLAVNSTMRDYKGGLSVEGGNMYANGGFGGKSISVASGASLSLEVFYDKGKYPTSFIDLSSVSIADGGKFILSAKETDRDAYKVAIGSDISSAGIINYGGSFTSETVNDIISGSVENGDAVYGDVTKYYFSVNQALAYNASGVSLDTNGRIYYKKSTSGTWTNDLVLSFNADPMTVTSIVEAQLEGAEQAFAFDMSLTDSTVSAIDTDSVMISFLIDDSSLTVSDFFVYSDLEGFESMYDNLHYDGDYLSFVTDIESANATWGWGYEAPAVPEPSTYAMIFGGIALSFAIYRRRK